LNNHYFFFLYFGFTLEQHFPNGGDLALGHESKQLGRQNIFIE